ncbi:MAG: exodeoxyribonuclease III [Burkholderiales bacterium 28-67-8]|nr:MAG: exodeoxyribonuclease III [Burkholderiales bacterium 28-67-8]
MLRLVTLNLNGIRSAATKGFEAWAEATKPDFMGVQEVKAQSDTVLGRFEQVAGMTGYFHYAQKKGYSGVGVYTRHQPSEVRTGIGNAEFDDEGRWVELCFDDASRLEFPRFSVISCYFPSGSSGEDRQQAKFRFLALIEPHLQRLRAEREFVLLGDINIAHKEIDLKNWKGNLKNSGFLPEERAWMTRLLDAEAGGGLVDVFRQLDPNPERYTWWSNRGQAWAKNVGWRIDYHLATPGIAARARHTDIHLEPRFSDHAPLTIDYDLTL